MYIRGCYYAHVDYLSVEQGEDDRVLPGERRHLLRQRRRDHLPHAAGTHEAPRPDRTVRGHLRVHGGLPPAPAAHTATLHREGAQPRGVHGLEVEGERLSSFHRFVYLS